jgi:hypothetical protein
MGDAEQAVRNHEYQGGNDQRHLCPRQREAYQGDRYQDITACQAEKSPCVKVHDGKFRDIDTAANSHEIKQPITDRVIGHAQFASFRMLSRREDINQNTPYYFSQVHGLWVLYT